MAEFFAYTTKLYFDPGTGALLIGAVRDIDGPGLSLDMVDVASRDSGQLRKRTAGLAAGGSLTFDIVYDPDLSTQVALSTALTAGTTGTMYLLIDDLTETGWFGEAIVESFKPKTTLEGALGADVGLALVRTVDGIDYLTDASTDYMVDHDSNYWVV